MRQATCKETQSLVAVKIIQLDKIDGQEGVARICREASLLQSLSHPHIIQFKDFFYEEDTICLVMERMDKTVYDLMNEYCDDLSEQWIRHIFKSTCLAVRFCHQKGIIHRDIKPDNIMVNL